MTVYQTHAYKHGVGWSTWHFQWVTKYRRRVFEDVALQKLCEIFLHEIAKRHSFAIEELEVASDHAHVVASLRPSMSPSHAVQLMKGYTARMLFMAEPDKLRKFYWEKSGKRSLWGDGKFIGSVGHITLQAAKDYVKKHEARHAKNVIIKNPYPLGLGSVQIFLFRSLLLVVTILPCEMRFPCSRSLKFINTYPNVKV